MQTSLARRQRHRRVAGRRPRGGRATRGVAVALPLALFGSLFALAAIGFVGAISAYAYFSRDLQDPKSLLLNLSFDQQTVVYDREAKVELARLGEVKRELVTFDELPLELIDATTAIEDKDFWTNPGFDPFGFVSASLDTLTGRPRGGSTITQQLVRTRLLPPRPDDCPPGQALCQENVERKVREIIQSVRLTQEFEGQTGKQQILIAYLNQNFYGNNSYGVKAAAKSYFGKALKDLSLAQMALLAAIPQSPTTFDLVRNAVEQCDVEVPDGEECPADKAKLVVPAESEVVVRRDHILDLMKTRSVLSGSRHTLADYEAAKREPAVLAPQGARPWKAAHFVWQVREQLAAILCPGEPADSCEAVDTGGYRVTTTLNWTMQQTTEKWVYAAARAPNLKDPRTVFKSLGIPKSEWTWLLKLRGKNLHNGAAAVLDYRTGEVLAYAGSASYTARATKEFQPQWDVLSDGWRQPGSSIKPLNYITGIDDRTMTAATLFMDVTTNFGKNFIPTQADGLERGPVRLRNALQFSLNIPSVKAGFINGLDHFFARTKDFGLHYQKSAIAVPSMSIGTLEIHPIDLLGAYGAIADGGVLMPRTMILKVVDSKGTTIWPTPEATPKGKRVASAQAAYIVTDILAGNTIKSVNPYWGEWAIYDGKTRRPAAYKTGTTNENRDVLAFGYLAPPKDAATPALAVGVWMGNSNNEPNKDTLSLGSSAPLWSRIMTDISKGLPIANFSDSKPKGLVSADVDAYTGLPPGPFTTKTVSELFIDGTVPKRRDDFRVVVDIDQATGLLWQDGCTGPKVAKGFLDLSGAEPAFPQWEKYTNNWIARAAKGSGVRGPLKGTRTSYFYNGAFAPFGRTWGAPFAPTKVCEPLPPPPTCQPGGIELPPGLQPPGYLPPCPSVEPTPGSFPPSVTPTPKPTKPPKPRP